MEILNFVVEQALVLVPMYYVLGWILKRTPKVQDWLIIWSILIASLGFTPLYLGGYTPENIVQAVLVAGATVITNQVVKQTIEKRQQDNQ